MKAGETANKHATLEEWRSWTSTDLERATRGMSNPDDVQRKLHSTWPDAEQRGRVSRALDRYGSDSSEAGRARVQLAILKLAGASEADVELWVEVAERDYRDVLAAAEYPEESQAAWAFRPHLSAAESAEISAIRARDREQYLEWLKS